MSSRESILNKLRSARQPFEDVQPIAQSDRQPVVPMDDTSSDALKTMFMAQGETLGNFMWQVEDDESALEKLLEIIGDETRVLHWDAAHIPVQGFPEVLAQQNIERADDRDSGVKIGITGVDCGVASTASLVLSSGEGKPRTVSLLPYVHVAILRAEQLVPNLEAWAQMQAENELPAFKDVSMTNIITGASRTADIGMELVMGAHGSAQLHCILIG